jgi:hypothetical protein
MRKILVLCITAFIVSIGIFSIRWYTMGVVDTSLWANQAKYIQTLSSEEYKNTDSYGHPGGPLLQASIGLHWLFGMSYIRAVEIFSITVCSTLVAAIVALCYYLRKNIQWSLFVLGILTLHPVYLSSTPLSIIASLVGVTLSLYTVYIYERQQVSLKSILVWSTLAGFLLATRIDVGLLFVGFLFVLLIYKVPLKLWSLSIITTIVAFLVFNPFMWFDPIGHVYYLVTYLVNHHSDYGVSHMSLWMITQISLISWISVLLGMLYIANRKKNLSPLPILFLWVTILLTIVYNVILFTAIYQVDRYFLPTILLWEVLLPLLVYPLLHYSKYRFLYISGLVVALIAVPLATFIFYIFP